MQTITTGGRANGKVARLKLQAQQYLSEIDDEIIKISHISDGAIKAKIVIIPPRFLAYIQAFAPEFLNYQDESKASISKLPIYKGVLIEVSDKISNCHVFPHWKYESTATYLEYIEDTMKQLINRPIIVNKKLSDEFLSEFKAKK